MLLYNYCRNLSIENIALYCNNIALEVDMQKNNIYETHLLSNKPLPFIFHKDTVISNSSYTNGQANWHPNIEILYCIEGKGTVYCETTSYAIEKNDIFIINSHVPHSILSDSIVKYHCLIIDSEFCSANNINTDNIIFKTLIKDFQAKSLFEEIIREYVENNAYQNAGIKSAVLNLMVYLARNYIESVTEFEKGGTSITENIKIAIGFIKSHSNEKLSLDIIANQAGLSKYYFLREFKNITGYTPISYINKIRCENAKKMLLSGNYNVKEISEKTGFDNFSYFSKKFKETEGCSPSDFIKKYIK